MSGKDERPFKMPAEIEGRPYMKMACGACYRNMNMISQVEEEYSVSFIFTCPVCGKLEVRHALKEEITRIRNSYEIAEN